MTEHYASVTVKAPVHQVYALFTHFDDFPKFMHFVKEVTYYNSQRSHWVVHVLRDYEWDAIHEDWIPDQQVGWRSIAGLKNTGKVKFRPLGPSRTMVDVYISYTPPSGPVGMLGDTFGGGEYFASILRQDLSNFARMVEEAPPGALDPMSSHYLFHSDSAVARGDVTARQKAAMARDPRMSPQALAERLASQREEQERRQQEQLEREMALRQRREVEEKMRQEQNLLLAQEAVRRQEEQRVREELLMREIADRRPPDPVHDTIGGRGAAIERTASGDRDGIRTRHPGYERDPMIARYPFKEGARPTLKLSEEELEKFESPWYRSIRGTPLPSPPAES
jgi:polyketide cyclase/dehydrase/lipid transport protein